MHLFDLTGRVAIVTGGNGGIGFGMARGLAEAGASIAVGARNEAKAAIAVRDLAALGVEATFVAVDVKDPDSCHAMVRTVMRKFGRVNILINAAGITYRKRPEVLSVSEWHEVLDVNLSGSFYCAQAAYPEMQRAGGGKIMNIGSVFSTFGAPFTAAYGASKGGLVQMSKALAMAWAKDNIQVNVVLPGWIHTDLTASARAQVEGLEERVLARTAAGRWGVPDDFAGIAIFLASSASAFITGAAIPVDGGYSAYG